MQLRFIKIFLFLFTLGIYHTDLFAQVKFTAEANPPTIGKDETTELRFTVDNAKQVDEITPPALNDFTIVSGPNQESSMQNINGVITQSVGMSYLIQPKSIGSFTIPAATAKADGKTLYSNSVTINVTAHSTGNTPQNNVTISPFAGFPGMDDPIEQGSENVLKKGENVQEKINKNMFLKAETDKTSCYVAEPIVVTYKSYSRLQSESSVTKTPAFNGFSMIDITPHNNGNNAVGRIEKLDGRAYNAYTLMKVQLYPLQPGQLNLGTVQTDNAIHFFKEEPTQNAADAFFQSMMSSGEMVNQEVTLKNKPVFITVKPLPEKGKPLSFKGAVGNFIVTASLDKDSLTTDDAGKLTLTIHGAGNMTLLNAPVIVWPVAIESFEPKLTDSLDKTKVPVTGSKQFDYNFTIQQPGKYIIPSIEFSFFDPATATYKTVSTKALPITVTKGINKNTDTQATATGNNNNNAGDQLNISKLVIELSALLIVLALFFWSNRKKDKEPATVTEEIISEQPISNTDKEEHKNYLRLSEEKLLQHDSKGFYEALNKEVKEFLSAYFHILPEEINKKRIAEELDKKGVSFSVAIKVQQLMDHIEWQLYTPVHANAQLEESFANAKEMIYSLDSAAR
jgi:oxygen tolerance protein BatD